MAKEFKQLRGNRIYLEKPEEPKSSLHLDAASKEALELEKLKTWGRLKVYAVGNLIEDIKEGDEIMIDPTQTSKVAKIPLTPDKEVLMISVFDVCHIW